MTTTFSVAVAAPALPASLKIPFLTEGYLQPESIKDTFELPVPNFDRYSLTSFDADGGEGLDWNPEFSLEVMNSPYDYQTQDAQDDEECHATGNIKRFSRYMDGIRVDRVEPFELPNGTYAYIDWMECIRQWRSEMTAEQIERIDWAGLNPSRYQIQSNGTFALIAD